MSFLATLKAEIEAHFKSAKRPIHQNPFSSVGIQAFGASLDELFKSAYTQFGAAQVAPNAPLSDVSKIVYIALGGASPANGRWATVVFRNGNPINTNFLGDYDQLGENLALGLVKGEDIKIYDANLQKSYDAAVAASKQAPVLSAPAGAGTKEGLPF